MYICIYVYMCICIYLYIYIYIYVYKQRVTCGLRTPSSYRELVRAFGKLEKSYKTKKHSNNVACNPDFKLLVALSAPRSAFLADFQPAGASRRPTRGEMPESTKKHPCDPPRHVHVCVYVHGFLECRLEEVVCSKALST
jgi:hypothetical protein